MNKINLILVVIGIIIILGFVIGGLWPESSTMCTKIYCACNFPREDFLEDSRDADALPPLPDREIRCNGCNVIDPIFVTGIFNIVRECNGREIVICKNYQHIDTRFDIDSSSCNYKIKFLGFR